MKHFWQFAISLSMLFSLSALALGDAEAGKSKAAICAACHSADGNSIVPNWPKLAGQHEQYLERQISLIKGGQRPVPEMAGIVVGLTEQDIADIAAFFSTQTTSAGLADEALLEAGEKLYRGGNAATEIPACMSCHGPAGEGNPLAGYPSLAGQHAGYSEKMLKGFRAGTTWGEDDARSEVMTGVSLRLTVDECEAVARYFLGRGAVS